MKAYILISFWITTNAFAESALKHMEKEGQALGKSGSKVVLEKTKNISADDFIKNVESFDPKIAKNEIRNDVSPKTDLLVFLQNPEVQKNQNNSRFNEEEFFIQRSDEILKGSENKDEFIVDGGETEFSYETCQESGSPNPISLYRILDVEFVHEPEQKKEVRVCLGHKTKTHFYWKSDAENWVESKKKKLAKDHTLQTYDAYIDKKGGGITEKYCVRATWTHLDNAATCDAFKLEQKIVSPERVEEKNATWIYDNESALEYSKSPDCVLIDKVCVDSSPRIKFGKEIQKPCWKEKLSYLCRLPNSKQCLALKQKNCEEMKRKCLKEGFQGCALWEVTYKCYNRKKHRTQLSNNKDIFGMNSNDKDTFYEPNHSFADIYTKMSLFEEIKTQLETENALDASKIELFKGKKMSCSKNVADNLIYDCCFAYGGLAKQVKLSQCSDEEVTLGEMRERGLCHYVGKYDEKMLNLWKSSDVHVYCCFPSKLARVFHEEARRELGMDWGKPKKPDCRGFLQNEIGKLDFTKIDLTEVFDKQSKDLEHRLEQKLKSLTSNLTERIKTEK